MQHLDGVSQASFDQMQKARSLTWRAFFVLSDSEWSFLHARLDGSVGMFFWSIRLGQAKILMEFSRSF